MKSRSTLGGNDHPFKTNTNTTCPPQVGDFGFHTEPVDVSRVRYTVLTLNERAPCLMKLGYTCPQTVFCLSLTERLYVMTHLKCAEAFTRAILSCKQETITHLQRMTQEALSHERIPATRDWHNALPPGRLVRGRNITSRRWNNLIRQLVFSAERIQPSILTSLGSYSLLAVIPD